ncbi:MAG: 16S rRNA (uracil(1498)-N(3))-methyltransferase [Polaromonas sp.]|uniref:16S rRNA (uracil(1498)-N(3))-methyltransferase n=1 Tax=Polaromonas sp. TaxID=1869339 RepID=UPI0025D532D7|nr:16S rRNA (uracil(1498)-N(3))-methyltransferase [Polaromonas sp.]MBI2727620.1 16S rRNA (uracil(1498)-N(3))-methyltransferase [Polaromonas sp.]
MAPRFYADLPLAAGESVFLPAATARHVQVLRMQPGGLIRLFNGQGDGGTASEGEFEAVIDEMGRSDVRVTIKSYKATQRESGHQVHLAVGMPANDRMDWLVEKATELGVASIQPLMAERSVLRLKGDRADKKIAHWRGVTIAACEQCGRNRVPVMHEALGLTEWLKALPPVSGEGAPLRLLLSPTAGSKPLKQLAPLPGPVVFLSGPEGGLSAGEETAAISAGFTPVSLGSRILRAETAPLACLAWLALGEG